LAVRDAEDITPPNYVLLWHAPAKKNKWAFPPSEADARLISLAPEMADILNNRVLGLVDGMLSTGSFSHPQARAIVVELRDEVRDLLARARGGS
jgi:SHS2 domain-containing protein